MEQLPAVQGSGRAERQLTIQRMPTPDPQQSIEVQISLPETGHSASPCEADSCRHNVAMSGASWDEDKRPSCLEQQNADHLQHGAPDGQLVYRTAFFPRLVRRLSLG